MKNSVKVSIFTLVAILLLTACENIDHAQNESVTDITTTQQTTTSEFDVNSEENVLQYQQQTIQSINNFAVLLEKLYSSFESFEMSDDWIKVYNQNVEEFEKYRLEFEKLNSENKVPDIYSDWHEDMMTVQNDFYFAFNIVNAFDVNSQSEETTDLFNEFYCYFMASYEKFYTQVKKFK